MKDFFKGLFIVLLAMLVVPLGYVLPELRQTEPNSVPVLSEIENSPKAYEFISEVVVYDCVKGNCFTLDIADYISRTLMHQLPESAPYEAIKAQAMVMYTYILSQRISELESPTPSLYGADLSTDSAIYPVLSLDEKPPKAFIDAVSDVLGKYISYNNEPIQVAYFISSGGYTESSLTVLGEDLPYLQSVRCEGDDDCVVESVYTTDEVFARLTTSCQGITLYGDPETWLEISSSLNSGYVQKLDICGEYELTGRGFAEALNLPSANFSFSYNREHNLFTFKTKGIGHLVGLSLEGACHMAEQNKTCEEIIKHFFTGVEIMDSIIN